MGFLYVPRNSYHNADIIITVRHDRIGDLRATNSPCSPDEWESILKSLLIKGEPVEGIEAGAEATLKKSIVITIRRRVAGINVSVFHGRNFLVFFFLRVVQGMGDTDRPLLSNVLAP